MLSRDSHQSTVKADRIVSTDGFFENLTVAQPIQAPLVIPFSYFNSQVMGGDSFSNTYTASLFQALKPQSGTFQMFNLALSAGNAGISSSGDNLEVINTAQAGMYEFVIKFNLKNESAVAGPPLNPSAVLAPLLPGNVPYVSANTGFFSVVSDVPGAPLGAPWTEWAFTLHGVVELGADASSIILFSSGGAATFAFASFNVTVKRLA